MREQIFRRCLIFALLIITSVSIACGGGDSGFPSSQSSVQASKTIGPEGGVIIVTDATSPIYNTTLYIPAGALSANVTISIRYEQTVRTFSDYIDKQGSEVILLPSGLVFNDFVYLTMPFAGVTTNDGIIGQLRDAPGEEASFLAPIEIHYTNPPLVTFPLKHFTSILPVGTIVGPTILPGHGFDSGFDPGDDGWHQPNDARFGGGGDCFAMSLFAIWYNANKGPDDPDLSDLLAGNPLREAKLRFMAFSMQQELSQFWQNMMTNERWQGILGMDANQRAYNILLMLWLTGEPQTLILWKHPGVQHAVVVTGYDVANNRFEIADPNYPGKLNILAGIQLLVGVTMMVTPICTWIFQMNSFTVLLEKTSELILKAGLHSQRHASFLIFGRFSHNCCLSLPKILTMLKNLNSALTHLLSLLLKNSPLPLTIGIFHSLLVMMPCIWQFQFTMDITESWAVQFLNQ